MRALFVAGHRSEKVWSELVVLPLSQGMRTDLNEGEFVFVVFLTVTASEGVQALGQNLVARLDEAFSLVNGPMSAAGLKEWSEALALSVDGELALTLAQISADGQTRIISRGGHRALIERDGRVGYLISQSATDWRVIEGRYTAADKWFWGTDELFDQLSSRVIGAELVKTDIGEIQAAVMAQLQAGSQEGLAGAIIDFRLQENLTVEKGQEPAETTPAVFLKEKPFKRRRLVALGILILLLVIGGVFWGGKRRAYFGEKEKYEAAMTQADQALNQVLGLADGESAASAAAKLKETENSLSALKSELAEREEFKTGLEGKIAELKAAYVKISGEKTVQIESAWYDLTLLKDGLYGTRMDQAEEKMEILDGAGGMVATLGFDKKDAGLTGSGELLKGGTLIAVSGKRTAVFVPDKGVMEINTSQKTTGNLIAPDSTWQRVAGLGLFSGNVYIVDAGVSDIYVYQGLTSGVGEKKRWLKPGQEPDLSQVVDMAVDGDIWTLDGNGKIRRFRQGEQIDFNVSGLERPWGKTAALVIPPDSDSVYVLDQENRRVAVLDKKGAYQKQYLWDGLAGATDIAVDETGGGVLVLSGNQIYRIEIEVPVKSE